MKRIFLVGTPRSGTTLLQSLIGCSPDIITFKESHLFSHSFSLRLPFIPVHKNPYAEVRRFYRENEIALSCLPSPLRPTDLLNRNAIAAYFISALDSAGEEKGKSAWLEKTPRHLLYTDLIEKAAARNHKEVFFIHLIRDGISVAASISKASKTWQKSLDTFSALQRWQKEIAITRKESQKDNHLIVSYESLLAQPEQTIFRLAKQLRIQLNLEDLQRRNEVLSTIIRQDETWKLDTASKQIGHLRRTKSHIGSAEKKHLEAHIDYTDYNFLLDQIHSAQLRETHG
ncbi:MAG: sulfotransferase [Aliivibrio sp.]|uniref:sulfotransferase family protein n=1 Tax=Aliivibrio sp. TaxID=1872443 RepID=UPI001A3C692F|nr:sulfotransferase [Aliivibrio sp.]